MLRSAPVAKERRVLAQRSRRRIAPLIKAASAKAAVKIRRKSLGSRQWAVGVWKLAVVSGKC